MDALVGWRRGQRRMRCHYNLAGWAQRHLDARRGLRAFAFFAHGKATLQLSRSTGSDKIAAIAEPL